MKQLVSLYSFLILFQLSIAASRYDLKHGKNFASKAVSEDAPMNFLGRSVADFGLMILCHVNRNPIDYIGYGCYCGVGGKGEPVDDTDRCCQVHDHCYNSVIHSDACPFDNAVYVMPYSRKDCYHCKPSSYYWLYGKCRHALCKCDSEAVQCFKRSKFHKEYMFYPQDKC